MVCLPLGHALNASLSKVSLNRYVAYPKPLHKPLQCMEIRKDNQQNADINKKQAVVTALGLYLGLKKATAPESVLKHNQHTVLCS